jgi:hypothetical protein
MPIGDDPFNLDFNDGMWARQNVATKAKAWRVDSPFGRRQFTDHLSSHFSNEANGRNAPTDMQSKFASASSYPWRAKQSNVPGGL